MIYQKINLKSPADLSRDLNWALSSINHYIQKGKITPPNVMGKTKMKYDDATYKKALAEGKRLKGATDVLKK